MYDRFMNINLLKIRLQPQSEIMLPPFSGAKFVPWEQDRIYAVCSQEDPKELIFCFCSQIYHSYNLLP